MKNYQEQTEKLFDSQKGLVSDYKKAQLLRVKREKSLAKKRLYPIHGDDWEKVFQLELKRAANISRLELQITQMDSLEIAEWIYELQEKLKD
ncbi:hypothetical protein VPH166E361_0081 [Vibrio phage 166E36-1]